MNNGINITISKETHQRVVAYIQKFDGKVGKWIDKAVQEKLEKVEKRIKLKPLS